MLWQYCGPIILILGVTGNILILLVMRRRKIRGSSTSLYLRFLAFTDIFVLVLGVIPEWLEAMDIVTLYNINGPACKIEKFSFYTMLDASIWILVVFTLDRFHALVFPFSTFPQCQPERVRFNVALVFIGSAIFNLPIFVTRGPEIIGFDKIRNTTRTETCGYTSELAKHFETRVRPWVVLVIFDLVPFAILLTCNIAIVYVLRKMQSIHHRAIVPAKHKRSLVQASIMCVTASACFAIFVTPSIVMYIGKQYWIKTSYEKYIVLKSACNIIKFLNHSADFFLFCISGQAFRDQLLEMLSCGRIKSETLGYGRTSLQIDTRRNTRAGATLIDMHALLPRNPSDCSNTNANRLSINA